VAVNMCREIPLGELGEITAGPSGSLLDNLQDGPDGVPVISPSDLAAGNVVDGRHVRRLPGEGAKRLDRFALQDGDLLVVRQGSIGRVSLILSEQNNWLYNSSFLRIRPRRDIVLPEYLAAYLSFPKAQRELLSQSLPGTIPSLNSTILKQLTITVPSIERQYAVIEVLTDIDSQIVIQRAIVDRLSALKSAIFGEMTEGPVNQ
jgi:type I restriction enzyme S subunit